MAADRPRRRVLVIDDNLDTLTILQVIIEQVADIADVDIAATVEMARARLRSGVRYDALITDAQLPDGSGIDVIRWVRSGIESIPTQQNVFVIVCSAFASLPDPDNLGFLFRSKPILPTELVDMLIRGMPTA